MDKFIYKKSTGVTALSASFTDFKYKKHSHKEYAIGVTLRGIQQYNLDGSFQSSYKNGVMLFNPEQPHDGMAHDESGIDYVMLYIEPAILIEILGRNDIFLFSSPIVYNNKLEQRILNLSNAILREENEAFTSELLISLADCFAGNSLNVNYKTNNTIITRAKEMICSNFNKVISLDDICAEMDMSKFKFIRLFKANTGISPYQYFLNGKLELAKKLIEKNRDVYSAVAECGFVDLTHLNRHFKSIYGVTAFEYITHLN
jgi:AraC-like DNA-binding protein